jgi:Fe-S-cluster containining protein
MIEPPEPQPDSVTAEVNLKIAGAQVRLGLTVPTAPVRAGAILPVFRSLAEAIEADVASGLEEQGKRISCRAGCGACCRQLVPVTHVEARQISAVVESFPEPRRSTVRARFADVLRRLEEAGMLETLRHPERIAPEQREAVGLAYFALGIPCTFLEEESCSIHEDRPLACREFLVTSPPEHCADPAAGKVEGVKLPVHLSNVLARFADPESSGLASRVPLPLALEWSGSHPDDSPTRPGPVWVEHLFQMLSGRSTPTSEPT